jgi:hypothetical protein
VAVLRGARAIRGLDGRQALLLEAGLASAGASLLHGVVDDPLYASRGLLLWFVPLGIIGAVCGWQGRDGARTRGERRSPVRATAAAGAGTAVALTLTMLAGGRTVSAAWEANLGALEQARVELSAYDQWHFDDPTLDEVRRSGDLEAPLANFARALRLEPGQVTASQRLAAIALARGDYAAARRVTDGSIAAGHRDPATLLLAGDALVATGEPEAAAAMVAGLPYAIARLQGQAWSRYERGGDWARAADAYAAVTMLDPTDAAASAAEERARRNAGKP